MVYVCMIGIVERKPEWIQKSLLDEEFEKYYVAAKLQHGCVHIVNVYKLLSYSWGKKIR